MSKSSSSSKLRATASEFVFTPRAAQGNDSKKPSWNPSVNAPLFAPKASAPIFVPQFHRRGGKGHGGKDHGGKDHGSTACCGSSGLRTTAAFRAGVLSSSTYSCLQSIISLQPYSCTHSRADSCPRNNAHTFPGSHAQHLQLPHGQSTELGDDSYGHGWSY